MDITEEQLQQIINSLVSNSDTPESETIQDNMYKQTGQGKEMRENIEFLKALKEEEEDNSRLYKLKVFGYDS